MRKIQVQKVTAYKYKEKYYESLEELKLEQAKEELKKAKRQYIQNMLELIPKRFKDYDIYGDRQTSDRVYKIYKDSHDPKVYEAVLETILLHPEIWNRFFVDIAKVAKLEKEAAKVISKSNKPWYNLW